MDRCRFIKGLSFFILVIILVIGCSRSSAMADEKPDDEVFETSICVFGSQLTMLFEVVRDITGPENGVRLKLEATPDIRGLHVAIRAEKYDFFSGGWMTFADMRARKQKQIKFVGAPLTALYRIYVPAASDDINSLADIKGKKIGIYGNPAITAAQLLKFILKQSYNIDLERDAEVLYGAAPVIHETLKRGDLDVVFNTLGAVPEILDETRFRIISDLSDEWSEDESFQLRVYGIGTYDDVLEKNPEGIERFVKAYREAARYLIDNPEKAEKILGRLMGLPEGEMLTALTRAYINAIDLKWNQEVIDKHIEFGKSFIEMFGTDVVAGIPDDYFVLTRAHSH